MTFNPETLGAVQAYVGIVAGYESGGATGPGRVAEVVRNVDLRLGGEASWARCSWL